VLLAGVLSNSIEFQSEDHPSRMGLVVMMMPGDGESAFHELLV